MSCMRAAGVDYLKYDSCNAKREDWVIDRYAAMRDALNATGRPILYSLCNWGVMEPWLWGPEVGGLLARATVGPGGDYRVYFPVSHPVRQAYAARLPC